ncbi:hypothetical protein AB0L53_42445 [Nonomuraea sp. NPDC052129]|uniref:hypothetical protein n=1 Tax=Nonomuraea sp. NPDC052129 TaxID=3154651 RepID=UPI00344829ED
MTALHPRIGTGLWLVPATATVVRLCDELDIVLGLAAPRPHLARVLRLTGLDHSFPMYGTPGRGRAGFGSAAAR